MMLKIKKAFTLIELLVVIAIIAILASLLMPSLTNAMKAAQQVACVNNFKQVGLGFNLFASDENGYLPYARSNDSPTTWDFALRTYLGASELTRSSWDQMFTEEERISILKCPGSEKPDVQNFNGVDRAVGSYLIPSKNALEYYISVYIAGVGTPPRVKVSDVNASKTLQLTEMDFDIDLTNYWGSVFHAPFQGYGLYVSDHEKLFAPGSHSYATNATVTNNTSVLHPSSQINFLFVDGHVKSTFPSDPDMVGDGTVDWWGSKGVWSIAEGD